jgi:predicted enzyme related to lactoylglutathione lyase
MKDDALNWFEIFVNDLDKAQAFYEAILKTPLTKGTGECTMAMFPCNQELGVGGSLTKSEHCKPGAGGTLVYLNVEGDLDGVVERIPAAGGKVLQPRMAIPPHGFIGIFEDPDGNRVGLHSMS